MQTVRSLFQAVRTGRTASLWLLAAVCGAALAATDIADAPLFTNSAAAVKPNIMFIFDDSWSMDRNYLPDFQDGTSGTPDDTLNTNSYGLKASQCNGLAYDPNTIYSVPVNYDGSSRGIAPLTSLDIASQFTAANTRSLLPIAAAPTVGSTISVTVSPVNSATYSNNDAVTIWGDLGTFIVGNVPSSGTNWTSSTGVLKVVVKFAALGGATFPLASPKIGKGTPTNNVYYKYIGTRPAMSYVFQPSGAVVKGAGTFYDECNTIASTLGNAQFTPVYAASSVSHPKLATLSDAQNFANWTLYYTTRMKAMKAGISLAFKDLDESYRIGFTTLSSKNVVAGTTFLDVADFTPADPTSPVGAKGQKHKFYDNLWLTQTPAAVQSTPLRAALAKVGQYYAKKAINQTYDPIQYSCQRNYTIMSTDGYWNTYNEDSTYGPYKLDRTTKVGQQDGGVTGTQRPMFDGGSVTQTTDEKWTRTEFRTARVDTPRLKTSTNTTSTTTTTVTPQTQTISTVIKDFTSGSLSRSGSTVTVTTSSPHNLNTGDTVNISGGNNSNFTGTGKTVTVTGPTTFTYPGPSSGNPGNTAYTFDPSGTLSCPAGQGMVRTYTQSRTTTDAVTTSVTSTTLTPSTSTVTLTRTYTFANTHTVTKVNGKVTTDTTSEAAGVPAGTQTSTPAVITTGTPQTTTGSPVDSGASSSSSAWTVSTTPSGTGATCVTNTPAPGPINSGAGVPTRAANPPSSTNPAPVASSDIETPLATTSSIGAKTTTSRPDVSSGNTSDTLADVAMYYYMTDLRTPALSNCTGSVSGVDVCENNVKTKEGDPAHSYGDSATWQHMTLFTIGLGVNGERKYQPDYFTNALSDFPAILAGTLDWPTPQANSIVTPQANVDDLWHAAVNGRGQYFSADNPAALTRSLGSAINEIDATPGSAAAASTSSLQPVQGDNDIYVAQFTTQDWWGDVIAYQIDPGTGKILPNITWKANTQLAKIKAADRAIWFADNKGSAALLAFTAQNLKDNGYEPFFKDFCTKPGLAGATGPKQCSDPTIDKTAANTPDNLVAYLRGDQTFSYYRARKGALGDVINASPLFIGKPNFKYSDSTYQTFATTNKDRAPVVLAAANDGMLHAFERGTGNEKWAFVPTAVMKNMYKLADDYYPDHHQFFVDGSPQVGDVKVKSGTEAGNWKTIVVGGLNKGGRSYYALDVTDTLNPKFLWEFSNNDLGLTYGNPIITRRSNGDWVVVFASGYNNGTQTDGSTAGDGNGHLFVLDAYSGTEVMTSLPTYADGTTNAVGTPGAPSGLAKIQSWVDSELDNTSLRFYGGDLLGNLWRFDIDGNVAPKNAALQLAQLTTPAETGLPEVAQAITTKPVVAEVEYNGSKFPVVYVGTGQYLGTTDLSDKHKQSLYAIKDPLNATALGNIRGRTDMVVQTITAPDTAQETRTSTSAKVDWVNKQGWRADFPVSGERVSVNPQIALDTIFVGTNTPKDDACSSGGKSFLYEFNFLTGSSTTSYLGEVLVQGLTLVQLTEEGAGEGSIVTIITRSDGSVDEKITNPGTSGGVLRRSSWRELVE